MTITIGPPWNGPFRIPKDRVPFLAEGGFGKVYGPIQGKLVRTLLPESLHRLFSPTDMYVIKTDKFPKFPKFPKEKVCDRRLERDKLLGRVYSWLPARSRRYFIVPIAVMCTPTEKIEIQPYGGRLLFDVIYREPKKWACRSTDHDFVACVRSLYTMMHACLSLACRTSHPVYLTDIKIENMVVAKDGTVRMIDFDAILLSEMPASFRHTAVKKIVPVQASKLLESKNAKKFLRRYYTRLEKSQITQAKRHLRTAHDTSLQAIACFSIVWVFVHIMADMLLYKCTPATADPLLDQFDTDIFPRLYHERYNTPHSSYRRLLRTILTRFLSSR